MRKSTFRAIIAFLLIAVFLVCGWLIGWQVTGEINPSQWGKPKDDNDNQTNVIITEGGSHGISLLSAEIPVTDFAAYGLDEEEVENAVTLTINVVPENSVVTDFSWSVDFNNVESDWATGKNIEDYIMIKPAEDNRSAVVACKQAFGEQIRIKVVYGGDTSIFATKMVDYVKKIIGGKLTGCDISCDFSNSWSGDYNINIVPEYGIGTVQGELDYTTYTACIELSEGAYNFLTSSESVAFGNMSKFLSANNNDIGLTKRSYSQSYVANSEWYTSNGPESFVKNKGIGLKEMQYYNAAFKTMLENVTNQLRAVGNITYRYGERYTETIELYGDWLTVPATNIELISDIGFNNGDNVLF